ncbi:hypothetical protein RCC89_17725 [Cytophagaceae bacterium ABcell3]|nr:hypothetical protein RCC89_17725 [Cytophagaceae bacterium ABcell3]
MKRIVLNLLLVFLVTGTAFAQDAPATLHQKWENIIDKSNSYQHYKVVQKTDLNDFWRNVQDTLTQMKMQLANEQNQIVQQQDQITQLQNEVKDITANLEAEKAEKEEILFLGNSINKYTYANTLWIIVGLIFLGCAVLFFLFKNSNRVTKQKIADYDHLFNRFEDYKKNTIEKERKLKRELQTHINLIEELKNRKSKV